ncbi:MAG: transcriptional regulator [Oscillibacter sp.]|nr:transcriptional regulator [Oscillibacter sp.]
MAFDFKKEYREFYLPKGAPELVTVPAMNYIAVRGRGDPNEEGGAYKQAIGVLYAVAYTLRMSGRSGRNIEGFFDYVVPPLEGFWRQEGREKFDNRDKAAFLWTSVIRLPDFVTEADFAWAVETASQKKDLDCSAAEFLTVEEGLCVQMMHVGSYDSEARSIALMDGFLAEKGYAVDLSHLRLHHEIYLSDARRVPPERRKTVIRQPVRKI